MAKFLLFLALCQISPAIFAARRYNPFDYPGPLDFTAVKTDAPTPSAPPQALPSLDDLQHYAQFTGASYSLWNEDAVWDCEACVKTGPSVTLHSLMINGVANTLGLINLDSARKEIIVTFRGTTNVQNMFMDSVLIPTKLNLPGNVKVHGGFLLAANSLLNRTESKLREILAQNPDSYARLVFVGHSVGSAMTVLNAFRIRAKPGFENLNFTVIGYGQPRIGNRGWADYVNAQSNVTIARVSNSADIATHFQLRGLQSFFIHSQNEVWIKKDKTVKMDCSRAIYEDPECSISVGPFYNLWDHFYGYFDTNYYVNINDNLCEAMNQFLIHWPSLGVDPCKKP